MTVNPDSIGRVRFKDIQYKRKAEFVVQIDTSRSEVILHLDQDVEGTGGFYSRECRVGLDGNQVRLLIGPLQTAVSRLPETGQGPNVASKVTFRWSDPGAPGSGGSGIIIVASSGRIILGVSPGESPETKSIAEPYIATFQYGTGEELIAALSRALSALEAPEGRP